MNAYPGMVVKVWSRGKGVFHFGIMSYDYHVIDHAPRKGTALRTWEEFSEGEEVKIVPSKSGDFDSDVIHQRALNSIGKSNYSISEANCEHFVNWCSRDRAESPQIKEKVGEFALATAIGVGLVALASAFFGGDDEGEAA
ncbi:MAG: hypothetical protein GQ574_26620 [Crocinitomix sp.]|nr:hypothetical protein [Crocinitomix sp.]